jgi:small GTP-binding protein
VKIALVGQPNSGKSTLFNAMAGYRSLTSNFAGTTVEYTRGQARVENAVVELMDLPGLYSLTPNSPVEEVSRSYLLAGDWDVIINVIDASQMARSLELTHELLDLESPMVVCLNMMDEALRKGMTIDTHALEIALGVPVVEAIGGRGRGIVETFRAASEMVAAGNRPRAIVYAPQLEGVLQQLGELIAAGDRRSPARDRYASFVPVLAPSSGPPSLPSCGSGQCRCCAGHTSPGDRLTLSIVDEETTPSPQADRPHKGLPFSPKLASTTGPASPVGEFPPARFRALQLLQSEPSRILTGTVSRNQRGLVPEPSFVDLAQAEIAAHSAQPADAVFSSARHAACLTLFKRVVRVARPDTDWREWVDQQAMHPVLGYIILAGVFLGFFRLIFDVGKLGEDRILSAFDAVVVALTQHMNPQGALFAGAKGAVLGTAGAVAMVLPYLLPFLMGLAILEDIGYLSRVGYLMDAAMHRLGLHGTATLPILVGYGCSVPAVMATRILTSRRDRFIASFLAVLVPCSARMTVIFALVGFYLGANYALGIYALNLVVVALSGAFLARIWPEISPGMLMEVPAYRVPSLKVVTFKTWWRLREFVLVAFPLLVVGSVLLSLVDFYGWQNGINAALSPFTTLLGLPRSVGLTLIFGVLRKELSLLMLMQALGTSHVLGVMTTAQILIFTLFVTFYLPCMATLASMMRELGWRLTLAASAALMALALVVSLGARAVTLLL